MNNKILGLIFIICSLLLVSGISFYFAEDLGIKKTITVDCYDNYNNKIIGSQCEKIEYENLNVSILPSILLAAFMFVSGFMLLIWGSVGWRNHN